MLAEERALRKGIRARIADPVEAKEFMKAIAALVRAVREDCAKVADPIHRHHPAVQCGLCMDRTQIAAAIRGRG